MPKLRHYATSAIATGLLVAGAAHGLSPTAPVTTGPGQTPAVLLPAVISLHHPVRVVSTALDHHGRPVITVRTATDRGAAAGLVAQGRRAGRAAGVEIDTPTRIAGTDPYRALQWGFAEMRVDAAWSASTGAGVTVAVLDSGVDATNPDLAGQVLPGADLVTGDGDGGADPNGHGTHVAGVIAARTGNDLGISSIAPNAKILPIRIVDANGNGYLSTAAAGIVYAADHGADVINMSIAARATQVALAEAVAYARAKGVVVVAAAGNDRATGSPPSYPAAEPGVIAVAATDQNDAVAGYSTAGSYVDVAAPGTNILSTFPVAKGSDFAYLSGTSMAAPQVAAVAALLKARDRSLTPDQIEQSVESSAVDLGSPGRDDDFGYGRVDAAAALATLVPPTTPTGTAPTESAPAADPMATNSPIAGDAPFDSLADGSATSAPTADPNIAGPAADGGEIAGPASAAPGTAVPAASAAPGTAVPAASDLPAGADTTAPTETVKTRPSGGDPAAGSSGSAEPAENARSGNNETADPGPTNLAIGVH